MEETSADLRTLETSAEVTSADVRLMTWRSEERRETDGWGGWAVETSVAAVEVGGGGGGDGRLGREKKVRWGRRRREERVCGGHTYLCVYLRMSEG